MTIWGVVLAVHILCAVIWVGGMFFAYLVLRPSLSVLDPPQRLLLHTQIFRRFFLIVWHVMPLILLTGFGMVFGVYGGPATAPWNVQAMMGLGADHVGDLRGRSCSGLTRGSAAPRIATRMAANIDAIRKLIGVNLVLGLITVFLAALGRF